MKLLCLILLCLSLEWPAFASNARNVAARAEIDGRLTTGLETFRRDCGRYPTTAEGWAALLQCPTNLPAERWHGPYLDRIPLDPWGSVYVYACPGLHHPNGFDPYSCGPDEISKSQGSDPDDINNWNLNLSQLRDDFGPDGLLIGALAVNLVLALVAWVVWSDGRPGKAVAGPAFNRNTWEGLGSVILFMLGVGLPRYWPERLLPHSAEAGVGVIFCGLAWYALGLVLAISGVRSRTKIGILAGLAGLFDFLIIIPWLCMPRIS